MSPTNDYRATTLTDAYRVCYPEPLEGEDLDKYYYDLSQARKSEAIGSVSFILKNLEPEEKTIILFTGHRGGGKTTELKRIQNEWAKEFLIVYFKVDEELDINDARYTDLYLVIIRQVELQLRQQGIILDRGLMDSFGEWFKEITQETVESVEKSVGVDGSVELGSQAPFLAKLWFKLLSQIKGSHTQKKTIRETLDKELSRLKSNINALLADGRKKLIKKYPTYKGILVIVDNLDRVSPKVGDHLFFDYAVQLKELDCNLIYTVPLSIVYSPKNVCDTFDQNPSILPMVNIYEYNPQVNPPRGDLDYRDAGLESMVNLIEKRVNVEQIFSDRQDLLEMVKASGGHVRQLMRMMRTACRKASVNNRTLINNEDMAGALKEEQFTFERIIPTEYYPNLVQVYLQKDLDKNKIAQELLFNLSVLEYNGDALWNYINPVVKQSKRFQQVLSNLTH